MSQCKMCKERGQTWSGEPPRCAFLSGAFWHDNWNCATATAIRNIVEGQDRPESVFYRNCDDDKFAVICTDRLRASCGAFDGFCVWVLWYKNRGGTDQILILTDHGARPITEREALEVIDFQRAQPAATEGK